MMWDWTAAPAPVRGPLGAPLLASGHFASPPAAEGEKIKARRGD